MSAQSNNNAQNLNVPADPHQDYHYRLPQLTSFVPEKHHWQLLGSELSPFTLKVMNYFHYWQLPFRFYYEQGNTWQNTKVQLKKMALVAGLKKLTWPKMSERDEFPLVPFVFGPKGEALYDSSAIADWFEVQFKSEEVEYQRLRSHAIIPRDDKALALVHQLIDEYFDDFGLYMVHHNRWKVAAIDNNAGPRLGRELRSVMGPLQIFAARFFAARQTRRLPYLFSVAPQGLHIENAGGPEVIKKRQPPAHKDFPPTHDLLEQAFERILAALEGIFSQHAYVLGERYSLADASIYGQLGMNLPDPAAARWIEQQAPNTYAWLLRMADADFSNDSSAGSSDNDGWRLHPQLAPLLAEIGRLYLPLMEQNEAAYDYYRAQGQTLFNEQAFWKNQALYRGELDGQQFKSVVKTFQVQTWQQLKHCAKQLNQQQRAQLAKILPNAEVLFATEASAISTEAKKPVAEV